MRGLGVVLSFFQNSTPIYIQLVLRIGLNKKQVILARVQSFIAQNTPLILHKNTIQATKFTLYQKVKKTTFFLIKNGCFGVKKKTIFVTKGQFQPKADCARPPHHRFSQKANEWRLTLLRNYSSCQKRESRPLVFQENLRRGNLLTVLTQL